MIDVRSACGRAKQLDDRLRRNARCSSPRFGFRRRRLLRFPSRLRFSQVPNFVVELLLNPSP